jgi:hypothetical protein
VNVTTFVARAIRRSSRPRPQAKCAPGEEESACSNRVNALPEVSSALRRPPANQTDVDAGRLRRQGGPQVRRRNRAGEGVLREARGKRRPNDCLTFDDTGTHGGLDRPVRRAAQRPHGRRTRPRRRPGSSSSRSRSSSTWTSSTSSELDVVGQQIVLHDLVRPPSTTGIATTGTSSTYLRPQSTSSSLDHLPPTLGSTPPVGLRSRTGFIDASRGWCAVQQPGRRARAVGVTGARGVSPRTDREPSEHPVDELSSIRPGITNMVPGCQPVHDRTLATSTSTRTRYCRGDDGVVYGLTTEFPPGNW